MVNEFNPRNCLGAFGNGLIRLEQCAAADNMQWIPVVANQPGYYKLKNKAGGKEYCIELDKSGRLGMRTCNSSEGQMWSFEPWKRDMNHVRVHNMMAGQKYCLDIVPPGNNNEVQMATCGNLSGQAWRSNTPDDMR
jgi:hypothetical protein